MKLFENITSNSLKYYSLNFLLAEFHHMINKEEGEIYASIRLKSKKFSSENFETYESYKDVSLIQFDTYHDKE
jgi:hypothetical protein